MSAPNYSLAKDKINFMLLEGVHDRAPEYIGKAGYHSVETRSGALEHDELLAAVADAHFLGIRSRTRITDEVLEAAGKLTAIGCFCIGTDQVDLAAARRRGIPVFNAPYANSPLGGRTGAGRDHRVDARHSGQETWRPIVATG